MFNQPQPLYLYGEVREYIKIEGRIFEDSVKEKLENITFVASNQMNQDANINISSHKKPENKELYNP